MTSETGVYFGSLFEIKETEEGVKYILNPLRWQCGIEEYTYETPPIKKIKLNDFLLTTHFIQLRRNQYEKELSELNKKHDLNGLNDLREFFSRLWAIGRKIE